jgi:hypothetical protein
VSVTVGREQLRNAEPRFYTAWTHNGHPACMGSLRSSNVSCPELESPVGYRTDANIVFDIFLGIAHREAGIAHWETVHARKWITSTVAEGTSSLPDVSGMYGFAACRPRHERIREPRLRVRQVLHDESRSCGDWSNEISQRQVGRKSVAQPKRTLTSRRPVYSLYRNAWVLAFAGMSGIDRFNPTGTSLAR